MAFGRQAGDSVEQTLGFPLAVEDKIEVGKCDSEHRSDLALGPPPFFYGDFGMISCNHNSDYRNFSEPCKRKIRTFQNFLSGPAYWRIG